MHIAQTCMISPGLTSPAFVQQSCTPASFAMQFTPCKLVSDSVSCAQAREMRKPRDHHAFSIAALCCRPCAQTGWTYLARINRAAQLAISASLRWSLVQHKWPPARAAGLGQALVSAAIAKCYILQLVCRAGAGCGALRLALRAELLWPFVRALAGALPSASTSRKVRLLLHLLAVNVNAWCEPGAGSVARRQGALFVLRRPCWCAPPRPS
jgi:hypothetical protein